MRFSWLGNLGNQLQLSDKRKGFFSLCWLRWIFMIISRILGHELPLQCRVEKVLPTWRGPALPSNESLSPQTGESDQDLNWVVWTQPGSSLRVWPWFVCWRMYWRCSCGYICLGQECPVLYMVITAVWGRRWSWGIWVNVGTLSCCLCFVATLRLLLSYSMWFTWVGGI